MKPLRSIALLTVFVACFYAPVYAGLKDPGCDKLHQWAVGYNPRDQWQATSRIKFPSIAKDEVLVPVFGQSILDWTQDDFREMNRQVNLCRKQASQRRDREMARTLSTANSAMVRLSGSTNQIRTANDNAMRAVNELIEKPDSQELITAMSLVETSLEGGNIRQDLRNLPRDLQQHVLTIDNSVRRLPRQNVEKIGALITKRKSNLQTAVGSKKGASTEELAAAMDEMAALPPAAESYEALERLEKLPALQYADPVQAQHFRSALLAKRRQVQMGIYQAKEDQDRIAGNQLVTEAIEELKQFDVKSPRDLGRFYDLGRKLRKEKLLSVDLLRREPFDRTFRERLDEAATAQLPAFRQALKLVPRNQLGSAVAEFTGIESDIPLLRPYHAAVFDRMKEIARSPTSE